MKKYILLFLLPLLLICNKSIAQDSIGISQYAYTISNDTLPAGSFDSTTIWVVNRGSSIFNDVLQIHTAVQDSSFIAYHQVDSVNFGTVSIPAGDSIAFSLHPHYVISTLKYHYDINVIVIWPVASNITVWDSLHYIEVITIPDGINEIDLNEYIKAYPNPLIDNLTLENNSKISIEEVRIYDSKGQLLNSFKEPGIINTEKWAKGVYTLDILLKNKQRHTIRVVKQ